MVVLLPVILQCNYTLFSLPMKLKKKNWTLNVLIFSFITIKWCTYNYSFHISLAHFLYLLYLSNMHFGKSLGGFFSLVVLKTSPVGFELEKFEKEAHLLYICCNFQTLPVSFELYLGPTLHSQGSNTIDGRVKLQSWSINRWKIVCLKPSWRKKLGQW